VGVRTTVDACSQVTCPFYGGQIQDRVSLTAGSSIDLDVLSANPGVALSSVNLDAGIVTAGTNPNGRIVLTGPAPSGGAAVSLSSNQGALVVPSKVTVSPGQSTATFSASTNAVSSAVSATVTGNYNDLARTASLTINPGAVTLSSVSLNPSTVTGERLRRVR
jgi:hypothetical protein